MVKKPIAFMQSVKRLIQTFLALALVAGVGGCTKAGETADSTEKIREFSHVLSPVFTDEIPAVEFSIPVVNDTPREVQFDVVSSSCSCTMSKLKQSVLGPGQRTFLDGRIAFHREVGPKSVRILLRNEHGPDWAYDVQMQCYRKVVLPLNGLLSFGEVDSMGTYEKTIPLTTYSAPGQAPVTLVRTVCDDDRIVAAVVNSTEEQLADGVTCNKGTLNVSLNAIPYAAIDSAVIEVITRQGDSESSEKIRVHWQLSPVFSVNPPRVFFRTGDDARSSPEKHVVIVRKDGRPFSIKSVSGVDKSFEVRVTPLGQSTSNVELCVAVSSRPDRNVWSKLCLETDAPDQEKIYIPLSGLFQLGASP